MVVIEEKNLEIYLESMSFEAALQLGDDLKNTGLFVRVPGLDIEAKLRCREDIEPLYRKIKEGKKFRCTVILETEEEDGQSQD